MAAGLRVPRAVGDFLMLRAIRASHGTAIAIPDDVLMDGVQELARWQGVYACPEAGAVWAAERVRGTLLASPVGDSLTLSAGVACYPTHALGAAELVTQAGRALEEARSRGRDRVDLLQDLAGARRILVGQVLEEGGDASGNAQ